MSKRKPLGKKLRFDVFKRDGFSCQYCGATPPAATLHVDHVVPVSSGGSNEIDNLVTSCSCCNFGKGATPLNVAPMALEEKAALVAEREAQLRGYHAVMEAKRERIENQAWEIIDVLRPGAEAAPKGWLHGIKRFLEKLPYHEVLDSMEVATSMISDEKRAFLYFCGTCWGKIREREGG